MPKIVEIETTSQGELILSGGKLRVAVLGATGMVGQQFVRILQNHPWFQIVALAASPSSAGQVYGQAAANRWAVDGKVRGELAELVLLDASEVGHIASQADIVFCAVDMEKEKVKKLEDAYARAGVWVTSNNSAFRLDPLTPMVIPSVNPHHLDIIHSQRLSRSYTTGGVIVKSNCSIQSYVIALTPLMSFGLERVRVHSDQAISGAGKTFASWPEMERNLIPLIKGEEEKSVTEPLKIWGEVAANGIALSAAPVLKARCVRVAVQHGHTAFVTAHFRQLPAKDEILARWETFGQSMALPSAPKQLIQYRNEPDRPQPLLDVMNGHGMAVTIGQLSTDASDNSIEFTALSHNAILGAAGGAVWATETALARGLVYRRIG
jgi:aspartate-semialdehyde dehydrogenase